MQLRLTSKLMAPLLLAGSLLGGAVFAGEPAAGLSGGAQAAYLTELKRLYLTRDARRALLAHGNALLDTYALRAGYQVGQAHRQDLLYHLRLGAPGELLVREETRSPHGTDLAVRNQRIGSLHPLRLPAERHQLRAVPPGRRQPGAEHRARSRGGPPSWPRP